MSLAPANGPRALRHARPALGAWRRIAKEDETGLCTGFTISFIKGFESEKSRLIIEDIIVLHLRKSGCLVSNQIIELD